VRPAVLAIDRTIRLRLPSAIRCVRYGSRLWSASVFQPSLGSAAHAFGSSGAFFWAGLRAHRRGGRGETARGWMTFCRRRRPSNGVGRWLWLLLLKG
jgi:hypothetical protein